LIFLHLPKTGGTTVKHILDANYPEEERWELDHEEATRNRSRPQGGGEPNIRAIRGEIPPLGRKAPKGRLARARAAFEKAPPEQRRHIRYMFGHMVYGSHAFTDGDWNYFTLLRDPVERSLSIYGHRTRHQGVDVGIERYYVEGRDHQQFNQQTILVAGGPYEDPFPASVNNEMLERAKENLRSFIAVGTTERFEEAIELLRRKIGLRNVNYERLNVAPERPRRDEVPQWVIDRIIEWNSLDIELHEFASKLLDESSSIAWK
jgi:hypothetical protein